MATRLFRALFVAVAVGALPLLAGCDIRVNEGGGLSLGVSRGRASDEWTRTYTVGKAGRFEIANENGAIEVRGTTGPQITVKAFREVTANSDEEARERLQKLEMREEVAPDRVSVRAETNEPGAFGFNRGVSVRYEVELPPGLTVAFKTQNGAVRLNDLEGKITAGVTNGTVTGREVSGSVLATSVNGSVQMDLAAVSGDVRLTTVNGGVSVDERLGLANVSSNRGGFGPTTNISGRLNKGGPHVTLQTTNGGIRVAPRGSGDADEEPGRPGRRGRRGPTPAEF